MAKQTTIGIRDLEQNTGQLPGLPKNPRFIKDARFVALKQSIQDAPEMLALRELLVYPLDNGRYVVVGGNMRLRACKDLGYKELPCKVIPKSTPASKLREYAIKDNVAFGQTDWTSINTEWSMDEVGAWGLETWQMPQQAGTPQSAELHFGGEGGEAGGGAPEDAAANPPARVVPPELSGMDLEPERLERIEGEDSTPYERVIICYRPEERERLKVVLGVDLSKVLYKFSDISGEA